MDTFTYQLVKVMFPRFVRDVENRIYEYESAIEEWQDYTEQLKDQIRLYTPTIVDYKLAKKIVPSVKLGKVNQDTPKGRSVQRNSYAMVLPGMPAINEDYDPVMDSEGIISFEKRVIVEPVNPPAKSEDSKANDKAESNGNKNGNKPSDKDKGSFESAGDDKSFYELVDLIMADRKVKKLPTDQFNWLKEKYPNWQKNPADNAEYQKRFNGKYPVSNGKK